MASPLQPTPEPQTVPVGQLGEALVAHWLQLQGWRLVAQGWHCRWGELDLVAQLPSSARPPSRVTPLLAFVEVKTRSRGNWDADGLLAITPQKQAKLWKTAQLFLSKHPGLVALPCRFDVALVKCGRLPQKSRISDNSRQNTHDHSDVFSLEIPRSIVLGKPIVVAGYQLTLETYLETAFSH